MNNSLKLNPARLLASAAAAIFALTLAAGAAPAATITTSVSPFGVQGQPSPFGAFGLGQNLQTMQPNMPADPLFVADQTANRVYMCDALASGNANCVIFRNGFPLSSPIAVTAGADNTMPIAVGGPGNYIWVANTNNKIDVFKIAPGFPFACQITHPTINNPAGIAYFAVTKELVVTNRGSNRITTYKSNCNPFPYVRQIAGAATTLSAPSGPSIYNKSGADYIYVANGNKALLFNRTAINNVAPVNSWNIGQSLEGTAVDTVGSVFWVTGQGPNALWRCDLTLAPLAQLQGCPTAPSGALSLSAPMLPSASGKVRRVYVPNRFSRLVDSYNEFFPGAPVAVYHNNLGNLFTRPVGTAVLF